MEKQKRWFWNTFCGTAVILILILCVMVIADPYFHYHGMISGMSYRIYNERYINDGILSNFKYDAIITGTSMNQNFKTSQMDRLWGTNAVKTPFSGAGFKEIKDNLEKAFQSNNKIRYVLWGIDYNGLLRDADYIAYEEYPEYLYDKKILNDVSYIWNKEILVSGLLTNILMTLKKEPTTTFDEYASWDVGRGWEFIKQTYHRESEILPMETELSEEEKGIMEENLYKNIISLAKKNPETTFVLFYTPYSILYWDEIYRDGTLVKQLLAEKHATELLLQCDNIELYSFFDKTDLICNLENYRDGLHYVKEINEMILAWITEGVGRVTKDNYQDLIQKEYNFYLNYNYDHLYQ